MRTIILAVMCLSIVLASAPVGAMTPAHFWSQRFGTMGDDMGYAVAVDGLGSVVVAGHFQTTANFGGATLVSAGFTDIFVAKYDARGAHLWSQRFGGTGSDYCLGIALEGSGNVVMTGLFQGTVDFGGGNLVSAGTVDIFVAKYTANGFHQWSQRCGGAGDDEGRYVAVDGSGNVVVTGYFEGTVNFGGGNLVSAGNYDIFLMKYNANGVHQWSQRFGSTGADFGWGVAVDGSGNALVTGYFEGTVNFGGGNHMSAGSSDIFVAKYNANGVNQWSRSFGSTSADYGYAIAVDAYGSAVVTGGFQGTVNFGGGNLVSAGLFDTFVAKYTSNGSHQWSKRFGSTGPDVGNAVAVDGPGNIGVLGTFQGTASFGGGDLVSAGQNDVFVAKYNSSGVHKWSLSFGSTGPEYAGVVAVDGTGNVVATGAFQGTVSFGGAPLTANYNDVFLVKYGLLSAEPLVTSIEDIGNDQGRSVRIQFSRSGHDAVGTATPVTQYEAYRRGDALPALRATVPLEGLSREQLASWGWDFAGETPAHSEDGYWMIAPTLADSTISLGQHYSVFFVRAATGSANSFFDSPVDSGYSLDNLAPGVPGALAYSSGILNWNESTAKDFDYFSVYGANTNSFSTATLVDYSVAPTMDVTASPYVFYFVTATDFSGNEGKPAGVNTLSGAGGPPAQYVLSISAYPNPFNPSTTIRYTVPSKGRVTVAIYDTRGARVAKLADTERAAGAYTEKWNGHDDTGRGVSSGVYFARVSHSSGTRSYKMVLLK